MADLPYVITWKEPAPEMCRAGERILGAHNCTSDVFADDLFRAMLSASACPVSLDEIVGVLEPFALGWDIATGNSEVVKKLSLGQLGALAANEVSGVHFQLARSLLHRLKGEANG
jgi:hypothetical protein